MAIEKEEDHHRRLRPRRGILHHARGAGGRAKGRRPHRLAAPAGALSGGRRGADRFGHRYRRHHRHDGRPPRRRAPGGPPRHGRSGDREPRAAGDPALRPGELRGDPRDQLRPGRLRQARPRLGGRPDRLGPQPRPGGIGRRPAGCGQTRHPRGTRRIAPLGRRPDRGDGMAGASFSARSSPSPTRRSARCAPTS